MDCIFHQSTNQPTNQSPKQASKQLTDQPSNGMFNYCNKFPALITKFPAVM
jgi:hypothetical protein